MPIPPVNPYINPINPLLNLNWQKDTRKSLEKIITSKPEISLIFWGSSNFSFLVLDKLLSFIYQKPPAIFYPLDQLSDIKDNPPVFVIKTVVTQPDRPVGRKQILFPSPVAELAQKEGIPVLKPEKLDEDFIKNHLAFLEADLYLVASYGKIIPREILEIPTFGALNIHPSLLPKYRGASPIPQAILNGDKVTGVTIIQMDEKIDHGPIVAAKEIRLSEQDNFQTLGKKLFLAGADLLGQILADYIQGKIIPQPQNHSQAVFTKLIKKEEGYFDPPVGGQVSSDFLEKLDRMIRAYYPWPTVWTKWNGKIIKFLPKRLVQMEGKKPVKLEDFLRGHPSFPIKQL